MKIAGIIAEYNPFHNGHLHHLAETRRLTGADAVVAVMSGDFVQRGVPAVCDKYIRAEAALRCGVDLVLELPVFGATASAEDFASAGIRALNSLGCVDVVSYGAEDAPLSAENKAMVASDGTSAETATCSDSAILRAARFLVSEPADFKELLLRYVREGNSYAKARSLALTEYDPEAAELLTKPNNILAVEYEKAILRGGYPLKTCAIQRSDRGYHDTEPAPVCSASAIRLAVTENDAVPGYSVPEAARELFADLRRDTMITADDLSDMLCAELSSHTADTLSAVYDVPGDLANRILENTELPFTWTSLAESAKCKAFTRSRIDRALCHALLHITAQDAELFKKGDALPYLRVLGVRKDSGDLLSSLCKTSKTPLLLRLFDDTKVLSEDAKHLLSLDLRASALYSQILYRKTGTVRNDGRRRLLTV